MIYEAILTQEGFEGSDAFILFVPRAKFCTTSREVRPLWVSQVTRFSEEELREQFNRYGDALDDAIPVILRELAARGED